jgi:lipoprotein-anchoring transpeptidase ErfK/SrfK
LSSRRRVGYGAAALVVAVCVVAATGVGPSDAAAGAGATAGGPQPGKPTREWAWRARIVAPTTARAAPRLDARPRHHLGTAARWNRGPVGLLVLDGRRDREKRLWLRVLLPRRPNGTSGWIPADRAVVRRTPWRVVVDVDRRRVSLLYNGRVRRSWRAVVGAPATPTPRGLFAIAERVRQQHPDGFIGSWALHLSAYSGVLDNFGGGPGTIGIHGRGGASLLDPLGSAASHGCIRIDNGPVAFLARRAFEGTPVRIV